LFENIDQSSNLNLKGVSGCIQQGQGNFPSGQLCKQQQPMKDMAAQLILFSEGNNLSESLAPN